MRPAIELHNPADMPDPEPDRDRSRSRGSRRPSTSPTNISGPILKLCQDRRGIQKNLTYVAGRAQLTYELPLNEVVFDFYDRLKSITRGYASFDYHQIGHREGDLVKMNILVNNEPVDALVDDRPPRRRRGAGAPHVRAPQGPHPAATCSRSRSRPRSAARSSPARPSPPCARTSRRNATAATPPGSASCSINKKRGRKGCGNMAR